MISQVHTLLRTEHSDMFRVFACLLSSIPTRLFSIINCEKLAMFFKVKVIEVWRFPYNWAPLEFLIHSLVLSEPLAIYQLQFEVFFFFSSSLVEMQIASLGVLILSNFFCFSQFGITDGPYEITFEISLRRVIDYFSLLNFVLLG